MQIAWRRFFFITRLLRAAASASVVLPAFWTMTLVANDLKVAKPPEAKERAGAKGQVAVGPLLTPLHLVDVQGKPVVGAAVAEFFWRDNDRESTFTPTEASDSRTSNERGEAIFKLEIPAHLDGSGLFAIRQGKGRPLVGIHKVTREEIGKAVTIVMSPACRVLFQIDSSGLSALEKEYRAELTGPGWWRAAYLRLGGTVQAPRPLFTSSTTGSLEFLLPPGRFTIYAYGSEVKSTELPLEVKPDDRELFLGTIDLPPSDEAKRGLFPGHRRIRSNAEDDNHAVLLRRVRSRALHGDVRRAHDVAFSPDGTLVATAHASDAGTGEVKLWDWAKGSHVAVLTAQAKGFVRVRFSPDGKSLFGLGNALTKGKSSSAVVVWDVATRHEMRTLEGHIGRILALDVSSDGKTIVSSGVDKTTRTWDVARGHETGRLGDDSLWGRSLAFAPDGRTLAVGNGPTVQVWDVAGNRQRAALPLETGQFTVDSLAYSPDGRILAMAGSTYDATMKSQAAQVRLYDVDQSQLRQRAVLSFDRDKNELPNAIPPLCTDVAFTPDGRRVIAVAFMDVRTWEVATAVERDAVKRGGATGSSDRLAVSPDGRWLAITGPFGVGFIDIPPAP